MRHSPPTIRMLLLLLLLHLHLLVHLLLLLLLRWGRLTAGLLLLLLLLLRLFARHIYIFHSLLPPLLLFFFFLFCFFNNDFQIMLDWPAMELSLGFALQRTMRHHSDNTTLPPPCSHYFFFSSLFSLFLRRDGWMEDDAYCASFLHIYHSLILFADAGAVYDYSLYPDISMVTRGMTWLLCTFIDAIDLSRPVGGRQREREREREREILLYTLYKPRERAFVRPRIYTQIYTHSRARARVYSRFRIRMYIRALVC